MKSALLVCSLLIVLLAITLASSLGSGSHPHLDDKMNETNEDRIVSLSKTAESSDETVAALPHPDDVRKQDASTDSATHKLELGSSVSMDHLGPIIVNTDGTTRRIANWNEMTESEQANAIRLISARNKRRIADLLKQQEEEEQDEQEQAESDSK